jgi:four helix bundle protein
MKKEDANQIEDRLIDLAVSIIALPGRLPETYAGRHVAQQVLRSGTAPAPNYGEARGAESRADFVHKLGLALKELNESQIWLKIIGRASLADRGAREPVLGECVQLCRIVNASIQTARRNAMNDDR